MDGSYNYEDCIGLRVRPRQGDGLLFYSLFNNGTIDPVSTFFYHFGYRNIMSNFLYNGRGNASQSRFFV